MAYLKASDGSVFHTGSPQYHRDCERLTNAEGKRLLAAQSAAHLRKILKPGSKVYCVLRSVSSSGMSRSISFYSHTRDGLQYLDGHIANVLTSVTRDRKEGLRVSGCGMDMGFHVVYNLGAALWPKGTRKPHGLRNGQPDTSGGYALKHEWI
jgi:hypothetical protein